jgi:FkbM family methyltransferase
MEGSTSDYHFHKFSVHGFYEWRNVAVALALLSKGDDVIEVGANIGTETVSFADMVGPKGHVHAFEPLPSNAAALRKANNLSLYKNIVVHERALSDQEGVGAFIPPVGDHSGVGHLMWRAGDAEVSAINVDVTSLDAIAVKVGPAKLIVTDMEGEECNFLRGAANYVSKYRPYLIMEAAPPLLAFKGQAIQQQYELLAELGYEVFRIGRLRLDRVAKPSSVPDRQNWVCLPQERGFLANNVRKTLLRCGCVPLVFRLNPLSDAFRRKGVNARTSQTIS